MRRILLKKAASNDGDDGDSIQDKIAVEDIKDMTKNEIIEEEVKEDSFEEEITGNNTKAPVQGGEKFLYTLNSWGCGDSPEEDIAEEAFDEEIKKEYIKKNNTGKHRKTVGKGDQR